GLARTSHAAGPEGEGAEGALDEAAAGLTGAAEDAGRRADGRPGLRGQARPAPSAVDAGDPDARLVRAGPLRPAARRVPGAVRVRGTARGAGRAARYSDRPDHVRLPAGGAGRDPLRSGPGPVVAEPSPGGRVERAVRRDRRDATPARPARALRDPWHSPASV